MGLASRQPDLGHVCKSVTYACVSNCWHRFWMESSMMHHERWLEKGVESRWLIAFFLFLLLGASRRGVMACLPRSDGKGYIARVCFKGIGFPHP